LSSAKDPEIGDGACSYGVKWRGNLALPPTPKNVGVAACFSHEKHIRHLTQTVTWACLNINKCQMTNITLYNRDTQEVVTVNADKMRYARMSQRIRSWALLMKSLDTHLPYSLILATLTYRENTWRPYDITRFLRKWIGRYDEIIGYAWVAELQARGVPHYHVVFAVPKGFRFDEYPDQSGCWPAGMSRIESINSPYYLMRYIGKEYQKNFAGYPKGMRLYGVSVRKKWLDQISFRPYWKYRLSSLTGYYRDLFERLSLKLDDSDLREMGWWKRVKGGGIKWDGVRYRSPWRIIKFEFVV
jgi:hypothetical protein